MPERLYVLSSHLKHDAEPDMFEKYPAVQGLQTYGVVAPTTADTKPAWQSWHAERSFFPGIMLYEPATHLVQFSIDVAPRTLPNVPGGHGEQLVVPGAE